MMQNWNISEAKDPKKKLGLLSKENSWDPSTWKVVTSSKLNKPYDFSKFRKQTFLEYRNEKIDNLFPTIKRKYLKADNCNI